MNPVSDDPLSPRAVICNTVELYCLELIANREKRSMELIANIEYFLNLLSDTCDYGRFKCHLDMANLMVKVFPKDERIGIEHFTVSKWDQWINSLVALHGIMIRRDIVQPNRPGLKLDDTPGPEIEYDTDEAFNSRWVAHDEFSGLYQKLVVDAQRNMLLAHVRDPNNCDLEAFIQAICNTDYDDNVRNPLSTLLHRDENGNNVLDNNPASWAALSPTTDLKVFQSEVESLLKKWMTLVFYPEESEGNNQVDQLSFLRAKLYGRLVDPLQDSIEIAVKATKKRKKSVGGSSKKKKKKDGDEVDGDVMVKQENGEYPTTPTPRKRERERRAYTEEEKEAIRKGVEEFGVGKWAEIKQKYPKELARRTNINIKDCFRTLLKQKIRREKELQEAEEELHASQVGTPGVPGTPMADGSLGAIPPLQGDPTLPVDGDETLQASAPLAEAMEAAAVAVAGVGPEGEAENIESPTIPENAAAPMEEVNSTSPVETAAPAISEADATMAVADEESPASATEAPTNSQEAEEDVEAV